MQLTYFMDHLFDLINESDTLNVADIKWDGKSQRLQVFMPDGNIFHLFCQQSDNQHENILSLDPHLHAKRKD